MKQLTMNELEAGLDEIARSPKDGGVLEMIVRRPNVGEREILEEGQLDPADGLVGDRWKHRTSRPPNPDTQLNLMNSRVIALLAQDRSRWPLAGDQLFLDLDLGEGNLPPGSRIAIGSAVIEVTAEPHTGCGKFLQRFGADAVTFVNAPERAVLHLRGINARVVRPGIVRVGDSISKL
jgi:MOSC domain-containing protein YiiM